MKYTVSTENVYLVRRLCVESSYVSGGLALEKETFGTDLAYFLQHVLLGVPAGPEPLLQEPVRTCDIIFYKAPLLPCYPDNS